MEVMILNAILATLLINLLIKRTRKDQDNPPGAGPPDV